MASSPSAKPRFRIVLPAAYFVVSVALLIPCLLRLGHSVWCQYFIKSMFPAGLIHGVLIKVLVPFGLVREDGQIWKILDEVLLVPVPFVLTLAQYYLIGLLVDRFLNRRSEGVRPHE